MDNNKGNNNMNITIVYNNDNCRYTIHSCGCSHSNLDKYDIIFDAEVGSIEEIVDELYGPDAGSFYAEREVTNGIDFGGKKTFNVSPCAKQFVNELPTWAKDGGK